MNKSKNIAKTEGLDIDTTEERMWEPANFADVFYFILFQT